MIYTNAENEDETITFMTPLAGYYKECFTRVKQEIAWAVQLQGGNVWSFHILTELCRG